MLQPRSYPEFVAKALVLDNDPFEAMVDDDNPWMEGFVLVTTVSLLAGIALAIGGFLTAATLPDPGVALTALLQGWRQIAVTVSIPPTAVEQIITDVWSAATLVTGYAGGWSHFLPIIALPGVAIVWWIFFSLASFGASRVFGGKGTLAATFGAGALTVAPFSFLLVSIVPFAGVGGALLTTWGLLIGYRAVHVAQELDWREAALTTLIVYGVAAIAVMLMGAAFAVGFTAGGFR